MQKQQDLLFTVSAMLVHFDLTFLSESIRIEDIHTCEKMYRGEIEDMEIAPCDYTPPIFVGKYATDNKARKKSQGDERRKSNVRRQPYTNHHKSINI